MDKYMMVIPACPHCMCAGEAPEEKLKINKLGPKYGVITL